MITVRKLAAALVLSLVLVMALFTTGAFARTADSGHGHVGIVSVNSVAVAGGNHFGGCGFGSFFPFWGFGPFFDGGAFAQASVHILGAGW